jgi:hypothetical protein
LESLSGHHLGSQFLTYCSSLLETRYEVIGKDHTAVSLRDAVEEIEQSKRDVRGLPQMRLHEVIVLDVEEGRLKLLRV